MKKQLIQKLRGKKNKTRGKKAHLTVVYHTCLHGHLVWLGPEVKHYGKYLFSASAIKWVSIYPLLHNSGYRMPSKPPETQDTSQNLKQNLNLNFLKLLSVSSLVFNHRMFNFEESLDYWMLHLAQNTVQMHTAASKHIKLRVRLRKFISHPTGTF